MLVLILTLFACLILCRGFLFVCFIAKIAEFVEIEIELRAQISFNNQMKGGESAITTINQQNGQNQWGTTLAPSN